MKRVKGNLFTSFLALFFVLPFILTLFSCRPMAPVDVEAGKRPAKRIKYISERGLDKSIKRFQQVKLAHLPTPLERMKVLSSKIGGPTIYIKRDDETGLAFGGNKARKLDFIIADAIQKKSDVIITWAGVQSNWCRQTAAASRKYGIKPILVLFKRSELPSAYDGNLLLDFILDADIRIIEPEKREITGTDEIINAIAEEQVKKGRNPYIVPVGGSRVGHSMTEPLGSISYTKAFLEIYREMKKAKAKLDAIVIATGSGGTQAGLIVGAKALGTNVKIVGISISGEKESIQENVAAIANNTAKALGVKMTTTPEEVVVFDEYIGEGYGILNPEAADAIQFVAKTEGILLDPVYTGKAMAGLIALTKKGYFSKRDTVVFLHTGGTPALFVYRDALLELLKKE